MKFKHIYAKITNQGQGGLEICFADIREAHYQLLYNAASL